MRASSLIFCGAAAAAFVGMAPSAHAQHTYPLAPTGYEHLRPGTPSSASMASNILNQAVDELEEAVDDGDIKGAVLLVARRGKIVLHTAVGTKDGLNEDNPSMPSAPMPLDGIFDLESMTKPFTVFLAMRMQESGNYPGFNIDNTVATYFPEFAVSSVNNKHLVTIKDLMSYVSGEDVDYSDESNPNGLFDDADPWHSMLVAPLELPRRTQVLYSDLGFRILSHVLETVGGESLQDLMQTYIFTPLNMTDTGFQPWLNMPEKQGRFVGTAWSEIRERYLRGEVQDETDYFLEGDGPDPAEHLTGCDGLFSTAMDLAKFSQMMLNRGIHRRPCNPNVQFSLMCETPLLSAQKVLDMTTTRTGTLHLQRPAWTYAENLFYSRKGYGWEMWDGGSWPGGEATSSVAYSKTGGAGTLMVLDPEPNREMFAILLTNHGLPNFDIDVDSTGKLVWPGFNLMINEIRALETMNKVFGSIEW